TRVLRGPSCSAPTRLAVTRPRLVRSAIIPYIIRPALTLQHAPTGTAVLGAAGQAWRGTPVYFTYTRSRTRSGGGSAARPGDSVSAEAAGMISLQQLLPGAKT